MINLKNVSKYYYKNGIIASGITKVNLQIDLGEFLVVTGESGSGKSTLLNVISGLDSYEEGEMFIDGKETSHYMDNEFAQYRQKYISNVFQNFNLVNSYTVYENVELILLVNGYKKSEIKKRVNEILKSVGLMEYANTKASKLSGGQRQRVAIARALAKDTDIIVADEPTGNLDSESAADIVRLLAKIASEKLVIVVTHNYEQFEAYATRKIKMHDGRITEDIILKPKNQLNVEDANEEDVRPAGDGEPLDNKEKNHVSPRRKVISEKGSQDKNNKRQKPLMTGDIRYWTKVRLGIRNAFNVWPKFMLLLIVFVFVLTAVTSQYTSYLAQKEEAQAMGYNSYFNNLRLDRIVIKKDDKSKFTVDDYDMIQRLYTVEGIAEYDILLDSTIFMESDDFAYDAIPISKEEFKGELIAGRYPASDNEVILSAYKDDYYFSEKYQKKNLNRNYEVEIGNYNKKIKFTVVGLAYKDDEQKNAESYANLYMSKPLLDTIIEERYHENSSLIVDINGKEQVVDPYDMIYNLCPSDKVSQGKAIGPEDINGYYRDGKATGKTLTTKVDNIYYKKNKEFTVQSVYNSKNFKSMTGREDYDYYAGIIFVNPKDYRSLYTADNYQATVFVDDKNDVEETKQLLDDMGYDCLPLKDVLINVVPEFLDLIRLPITIIMILALFFIAYFVIRLILKSRNSYFSILRMLGLSKKNIKKLVDVELFTVATIAFAIFAAVAALSIHGDISIRYINELIKYMQLRDYGILYLVLIVMSYWISGKFSKSLFKKSAMGTYREEE